MKQYETTSQDWFNFIAQGYNSNAVIQYVIKLKGRINFYILQKAVRLSIYQESILGCRFIKKTDRPIWKSISNWNFHQLCYKVSTKESQQEVETFLAKGLSAESEGQVLVCLICGKENDTLCIKINHAACDGAGSKYYLKLLAEIYTEIEQDTKDWYEPMIQERSTKYIYENLGINNIQQYYKEELAVLKSTWGFPMELISEQSKFQYKIRNLEKRDFDSLYKYAKEHGTTINSVLLATYYLELLKIVNGDDGGVKEIQFMVDLRKYLPSHIKQTICNLSAIVNIELPAEKENDFKNLINMTTIEMNRIKTEKPFIHGTIGADLIATEGFDVIESFYKSDWENIKATGKCTPMLSNLGILAKKPLFFGNTLAMDVQLISPAFYAPAIMLGVSTYCSRISLCISYYEPGTSGQKIQSLLDNMINTLKELIN